MNNCTGEKCIMQFDKVDPATCECVSYCPQATPPMKYDELVQELRYLAKVYSICQQENTQEYKLAVKAADAIEELMRRCDDCPHKEKESVRVDVNLYDKEEIYENCTVQILTNTITGKTSIGWQQND